YENSFAQYVLQLDAIEPTPSNPTTNFAVNVRDFYAKVTMPFFTPLSVTVGMQNRPFGYEIAFSSQYREVPERSRFVQMLFPNERDLGAMITLQAPNTSPWHAFKINAGIFNGTGIAREFDSKKDFIGQVIFNKANKSESVQYGLGVSYYKGGVVESTRAFFTEIDKSNEAAPVIRKDSSSANLGKYANREYFGVDAQISIDNPLGITTLRGEYVMGTQPGTKDATRSPEILPASDTYIRNFN